MGTCGGIIRLINCLLSSSSQVVLSAVSLVSVALSNHPANTHLFCLANGLDALMQIEENWSKKCACAAAKVLSNLLCSGCGVWV